MCHLYIYPPHYCMFIALVFLAHIYVDLIVSATNVFVVFLSTMNKHFLLLLLLTLMHLGTALLTSHRLVMALFMMRLVHSMYIVWSSLHVT